MTELHRVEERVHVAQNGSEALLEARASVDHLTDEPASSTAGTAQQMAERETMAAYSLTISCCSDT